MKRWKLFVCVVVTAQSALAWQSAAVAKVTRFEIASRQSYGTFKPGEYVLWKGRMVGELSPAEAIPDLDKVATNGHGTIDYAARFTLVMPADPAKGSGALLVDVPNRGRPYAHALYNSPREEPFQSGIFEHGTRFLEDHGFSIAAVHWEMGQGAELPTFTGRDGKPRYVEGAGLAIVRDAADFLAHASADTAGTPNPLKGVISRTLAAGKSQSGMYLKTFLLHGFNTVDGRRVFDGMHVFASFAALVPILQSGMGPVSSVDEFPTFTTPDFRGMGAPERPLTIGEIVKLLEARGENPPRMIMINTTTDYLVGRASLSRTGAEGTADQPIPPNVRVYDIAGASHLLVSKADCKLPLARLDWSPISRATLLRLDDWVVRNAEPPPSQLMPLEPSRNDPNVLRAPAHLPKAIIQVPRRDPDGNSQGGVRLPDVVVPLGVHGAPNQPLSRVCMLVGSYLPFAKTREERQAAKDEHPSIAERYKDQSDYVNRIRKAAHDLETSGFLLPEDSAIIIHSAAERPGFN